MRDENLEARLWRRRKGQGGTEAASSFVRAVPVVSLTFPLPPYNRMPFHRDADGTFLSVHKFWEICLSPTEQTVDRGNVVHGDFTTFDGYSMRTHRGLQREQRPRFI